MSSSRLISTLGRRIIEIIQGAATYDGELTFWNSWREYAISLVNHLGPMTKGLFPGINLVGF